MSDFDSFLGKRDNESELKRSEGERRMNAALRFLDDLFEAHIANSEKLKSKGIICKKERSAIIFDTSRDLSFSTRVEIRVNPDGSFWVNQVLPGRNNATQQQYLGHYGHVDDATQRSHLISMVADFLRIT